MKLPFRYQFALAPVLIVTLMAILVIYTSLELSYIRREHKQTVRWEVLTDRIQNAIANVSLLDRLAVEFSERPLTPDDERLFSYLEQTMILSSSLKLVKQIPDELKSALLLTIELLDEPEQVKPTTLHQNLSALLPPLQYQHKIFLSQRRTAFIDYHQHLSKRIPQLRTALIVILVICIALAAGITLWGMQTLRQRLQSLNQRAHAVCTGEPSALVAPEKIRDELDDLELCLSRVTQRLLNVIATDKVLQGTENERRRIAMDLHDGVLADLTAVTRKLDHLHKTPTDDPQLPLLNEDINAIIVSIRKTIDDLHPSSLEILGLEAAIQSFLDRHCQLPGLPDYHFEFDPSIENSLPLTHKIHLYRIITEAINNVLRHAHCTRFEISLRSISNNIIINIEDNGVGMPAVPLSTGHGYANITERARAIDAVVKWMPSRFATGTNVQLTLTVIA